MKFGLACEGITDQIVLGNILCGYFDNPDLDDEIIELQPSLDETSQKQQNFGGWEKLLSYLSGSQFHEHVLSHDHIIVQFDSDISEHPNFNVSQYDCDNKTLAVEALIKDIIEKLILTINERNDGFYEANSNIIFAICVHSLECWLYAFHNSKSLKTPKVTGCDKALNYLLKKKGFTKPKNKKLYGEYSEPFLERENIDLLAKKDISFKTFIDKLPKL